MFVVDNCYGYIAGATGTSKEFTDFDLDDWRIRADYHTIMCDVADNTKDPNYDSEHVGKHIGMSEVKYKEEEHSATEHVVERIDL